MTVFKKRLIAAIIDYVIVYMVSFAVCFLISTTVLKDAINQQTAPFAVIVLLINPFLISAPQSYGKAYAVYALFMVIFVVEVMYYSLFELLPTKRTFGYRLLDIRLCCNSEKSVRARIVGRNVLKVLSRYLFCIPFFISAFSANGRTVYDRISKISIETDN